MTFIKNVAGYGLVSIAALGLELSLLHFLLQVRLAAPLAVTGAYGTASVFQFLALRYIVFQVTHRPMLIQVNAYILAATASWMLVLASVMALIHVFAISTMLAREITIPLLFPVNYVLSRYVIFRR